MKFASLEPRIREYLAGPRFAVLATINPSGSPHLTEMWYGIKGDELFFNTTEERQKKANLDRDPRVSLLVSELKGQPTWRYNTYVRVDGAARLVATGAPAIEDIVSLSVRYDGPESEAQARANYSKMHRATYVIDIRRVYPKGL